MPSQPGGQPESAAHARLALRPGLAAHQLRQLPCDGQPQAGAAVLAGGGTVRLLEGIEQARQHLRFDTDAGVVHLETQQHAFVVLFRQAGAQGDAAVVGELDGVGGVVQQRCLRRWDRPAAEGKRVRFTCSSSPLAVGAFAEHGGDVGARVAATRRLLEVELAGLDLGQVQDVAEDAKQVARGAVDGVQPLRLARRDAVPHHQVTVPVMAFMRADLVALLARKALLARTADSAWCAPPGVRGCDHAPGLLMVAVQASSSPRRRCR